MPPSDSYQERYAFLLRRLREAREARGLTQGQVGASIGKPQSYIAKIELGERRVDVIELYEIANLYGLPVSYFISES